MTTTKPTELCLGTPEHFDGSFDNSRSWMNTVQFYLTVNKAVYNTDEKKIAFALSYMTKGSALTWAATFRTNCISGTMISFESFTDFVSAFKTSFKQRDVMGTAVTWLTTTRMTKKQDGTYSPSLTDYISTFQNNVALATITDHNVLIGYFSAGIPPSLMKRIMSMDTVPSKVDEWYSKAIHFQTQWERAEEIALRNQQLIKGTYHSFSSPPKNHDLDAMDVDVVKITRLTPEERKRCIEKGLCFRCCKAGHLSGACPTFSTPIKKVQRVRQEKETEEQLPTLREIEDDNEDVVSTHVTVQALPKSMRIPLQVIEPSRTMKAIDTHALIDSGADISCLDHQFARKHRLPLTKLTTPVLIRNADLSENKQGLIKYTCRLFLNIEGLTHNVTFHVISCGKENLILGLPWLQTINPKINWHTKTLSIPESTDQSRLLYTLHTRDTDCHNQMYYKTPTSPSHKATVCCTDQHLLSYL